MGLTSNRIRALCRLLLWDSLVTHEKAYFAGEFEGLACELEHVLNLLGARGIHVYMCL